MASGPIIRLSSVATNPHEQATMAMPVRTRPLGILPVRTSSIAAAKATPPTRASGRATAAAGDPPTD